MNLPYLAKSKPPETLDTHTEKVWKRFWGFWQRAGLRNSALQEALAVAAFVHDFGKAHLSFQRQLEATNRRAYWGHRHELLSAAFLRWFFPQEDPRLLWAAAAVLTHHKDLPCLCSLYSPDAPDDWAAPRDKLFEALTSTSTPSALELLAQWTQTTFPSWWEAASGRPFWGWATPPSNENPATWPNTAKNFVQKLLEQLNRLAASPLSGSKVYFLSRGFLLLADRLASAGGPEPAPVPWGRIALTLPTSPYAHQQQAAKASKHLLLIAPTGSGKTEAALLWAHSQHQKHPTHALLYILPYQANLNAMWLRFQERYGLAETEVALWHSRALLVQFLTLQDQHADPLTAAATLYNHAQLMRPPVFLSTPYQLLKALFSLPGHETLWSLSTNSLLIADEIHSYAPYRSGLFLGLLHALTAEWGARLCLMTATLPRWMEGFLRAKFTLEKITPDASLYKDFTRHRLYLRRGTIEEQLSHAEKAAYAGEKVLLVANTVCTAQRLYQALKSRLTGPGRPHLLLLHSRFTAKDRVEKEKKLYELLEKPEGLIVVATQVVEVSLDVSFDRLYTELAPMEALIQRFGRVNRRRKASWKPVYVCTQPTSWKYPYGQPKLLRRVRMLLRALHGHKLAEHRLPSLVQRSYGRTAQKLRKEVARGFADAQELIQKSVRPLESDTELVQQYDELFDGKVVLPASLRSDYESARNARSLQAQLYLLSLPACTLQALQKRGQAEKMPDEALWIIHLPYDSEIGLDTCGGSPEPTPDPTPSQDFVFIE